MGRDGLRAWKPYEDLRGPRRVPEACLVPARVRVTFSLLPLLARAGAVALTRGNFPESVGSSLEVYRQSG